MTVDGTTPRHDRTLTRDDRRRSGAFYTPGPVVEALLERTLAAAEGPVRTVLDPACGDGAFLEAAARRSLRIVGVDLDAAALAAAAARLPATADLRLGDALLGAAPVDGSVDVVVGNPPFLGQLKADTALGRTRRRALAERFPHGGPYTDEATRFLDASLEWVRPGGAVGLILPVSFLSARDAGAVRHRVLERATVEALWLADDGVFEDASVRVCAVVLRRHPDPARPTAAPVRLLGGVVPTDAGSGPHPRDEGDWGRTVAPLLGVPAVASIGAGAPLGSVADAVAGFRDEFYGLAGEAEDRAEGSGPRLVTSGLVDPVRHCWGERPVRLGGVKVTHPRLRPDAVLSPRVARFVDLQRRPKVLVATQTRVVEAAVDAVGDTVAVTPVVAVLPHEGVSVWEAAAALLAPPVSLLARVRTVGAALSADAIKLSARQVLELPVPTDPEAWRRAAGLLEAGRWAAAARLLTVTHVGEEAADEVLDWWSARLPATVRTRFMQDADGVDA